VLTDPRARRLSGNRVEQLSRGVASGDAVSWRNFLGISRVSLVSICFHACSFQLHFGFSQAGVLPYGNGSERWFDRSQRRPNARPPPLAKAHNGRCSTFSIVSGMFCAHAEVSVFEPGHTCEWAEISTARRGACDLLHSSREIVAPSPPCRNGMRCA
jgi:hypothetical protein